MFNTMSGFYTRPQTASTVSHRSSKIDDLLMESGNADKISAANQLREDDLDEAQSEIDRELEELLARN